MMMSRTTSGFTKWSMPRSRLRSRQHTPRTPLCFSHFAKGTAEVEAASLSMNESSISSLVCACMTSVDPYVFFFRDPPSSPSPVLAVVDHNFVLSPSLVSASLPLPLLRKTTDVPSMTREVQSDGLPEQLQLAHGIFVGHQAVSFV